MKTHRVVEADDTKGLRSVTTPFVNFGFDGAAAVVGLTSGLK